MKKNIFLAISLISCIVCIIYSIFFLPVIHDKIISIYREQLKSESKYIMHLLEKNGIKYLETAPISSHRITLTDKDGTVLYDNQAGSLLPSHANRQEIRQAQEQGEGYAIRHSETLGRKTVYMAFRLKDGKILRLSDSADSVFILFFSILPYIFLALIISFILGLWLAKKISTRIISPIIKIDLDHPENSKCCEELAPLVSRLIHQREIITSQIDRLNQKHKEFETVAANMCEGLLLLDSHYRILFCNSAAMRLLGLSEANYGSNLLAIYRDNQLWEAIENASATGSGQILLKKNGRWIQIYINKAYNNDNFHGYVLLWMDVTEKEERDALRREFGANVSHELKTPLTTIAGIAEIMKNGIMQTNDISHFATTVYNESRRLIRLVNDILRLSQLETGQVFDRTSHEKVNLNEVIAICVDRLEPAAKTRQISFSMNGDTVFISGIRPLLEEMIFNLCENAVKYNRIGGRIDISLTAPRPEAQEIILSIADTGFGIPENLRERVFERFFRIDKSRSKQVGGTGLGLSITRHIAVLHDASITFSDNEPYGLVVNVKFPFHLYLQ